MCLGAFSVGQVISSLNGEFDRVVPVLRHYVTAVLAVYMALDCPELESGPMPSNDKSTVRQACQIFRRELSQHVFRDEHVRIFFFNVHARSVSHVLALIRTSAVSQHILPQVYKLAFVIQDAQSLGWIDQSVSLEISVVLVLPQSRITLVCLHLCCVMCV